MIHFFIKKKTENRTAKGKFLISKTELPTVKGYLLIVFSSLGAKQMKAPPKFDDSENSLLFFQEQFGFSNHDC